MNLYMNGYGIDSDCKFRLRIHFDNLATGSQETDWYQLESLDKQSAIIEARALVDKAIPNDPLTLMPFRGAVLIPSDKNTNYLYCFKVRKA